jgi:hypothetical protein
MKPKGVGTTLNAISDIYLGVQRLLPSHSTPPRGYLAVATIFRQEAPWLREWIEYHLLLGVDHFFLYNNHSRDDFRRVLRPYQKSGLVTLYDLSLPDPFNRWQIKAINHAAHLCKGHFTWLAVIDVDEFIVPHHVSTIPELLRPLERHAAIFLHWQMFGTTGISRLAQGQLSIEHFTRKAEPDYNECVLGKSIVQPNKIIRMKVHEPVLPNGINIVLADGSQRQKTPTVHTAQINHYWTRDENYFWNQKVIWRNRYAALVNAQARSEQGWRIHKENFNNVDDYSIHRFLPELKNRFEIKHA